MVCLAVSYSQCTCYYLTNVNHSGICLLLINKHRLLLKSDPPLEAPNLLDPDHLGCTVESWG